jgi:hypothetical protein
VLEVQGDEFVALTRDLTDPSFAEEQVTLPTDDVPTADRELFEVGAVFYWTIGYRETASGTRERVSTMRFRRLPAWSRRDLQRVDEAADELQRLFGTE